MSVGIERFVATNQLRISPPGTLPVDQRSCVLSFSLRAQGHQPAQACQVSAHSFVVGNHRQARVQGMCEVSES